MAQERLSLQGRVTANDAVLPGAFIINKQTGEEVKTGANGTFTIAARAGDRLVVYSNTTEVREFSVGADTFAAQPYELAVEVKAEQLDAVVIEAPTVTSESLGLVPENQKRMTVAERRVHTASTGPLDILLNLMSGKKQMLKRELDTEQKVMAMDGLNGLVNEDEVAAHYGIAPEMVQGFLFYAVEQPRIVGALNEGNEKLVELLLLEAAAKYKELQESQSQTSGAAQQSSDPGLRASDPSNNQQPATNNQKP